MLGGVYIPTDFSPQDRGPRLAPEQKLEIIQSSPVVVEKDRKGTKIYLPFGVVGRFNVLPKIGEEPPSLMIHFLAIDDENLYGKGIGSRMLKAATRQGLEQVSSLETVYIEDVRWGLLNTAVRVFGEENVSATEAGVEFGRGSAKPLEAILDVKQYVPGHFFAIDSLRAVIDRSTAAEWELPVAGPPPNGYYYRPTLQ